jgi:hypothetical protein
MLDGAPLILLGMGAVSLLTVALARRKRSTTTLPTSTQLSAMSTAELSELLGALDRTRVSEVRRTVTVLLIREELERREPIG